MVVKVMFRITNIQTRVQETCTSRDELLSIINEQSVWAEDRSESVLLQLEQLAEDGSILDSITLSLPLQEIVEEALASFGLKREKKSFSLLQRNKSQKVVQRQEPTKEKEPELRKSMAAPPELFEPTPEAAKKELKSNPYRLELGKPAGGKEFTSSFPDPLELQEKVKVTEEAKIEQPSNSTMSKKTKTEKKTRFYERQFLWKLLALAAFGTAFVTLAYTQSQSQSQFQKVKQLEERIALQENQGRIEVVGRFFIANYFADDSNRLKPFLAKDLKAEGVKAKSGQQVQSTIFESVSHSKKTFFITFIVTTKAEDGSVQTIRLTLPFQEDKQSTYGYVLNGQPKFSSFAE